MEKKDLLLYLDIPFCPVHCAHCEKRAIEPRAQWRVSYIRALSREIRAQAGSVPDYEVRAIWVGGGIPGHMADPELGELLHELPRIFPVAEDAEVTLKVHPGMVSTDTLDLCRRGRVTRLSVEYVTRNSFEYENLNRFLQPSAMDVTDMVLRPARVDRSFDILTGLPGQEISTLWESLNAVIAYGACHISIYPLRLPEGSDLRRRAETDPWHNNPRRRLPGEEDCLALTAFAGQFLNGHGFREYLPGRWALPGKECRYFELEEKGTEFLGFGLGAVTELDGIRSVNTDSFERYLRCSGSPDKLIDHAELINKS